MSEANIIFGKIEGHLDQNRRQFVDYEIYTIGGNDYQQWSASSPENFNEVIDEDILSLSAQTARFG